MTDQEWTLHRQALEATVAAEYYKATLSAIAISDDLRTMRKLAVDAIEECEENNND